MAEDSSEFECPRKWDPTWNDQIDGFKEVLVARARYKGTFGRSPDLMQLVESAACFSEVYSTDDWNWLLASYPSEGLPEFKVTQEPGEDFPARMLFISQALDSLLNQVGAPSAFKSDVALLCSQFAPRGAPKYGEVQRSMIENMDEGPSRIAAAAGVDRSTVHDLIRRKAVIRPSNRDTDT